MRKISDLMGRLVRTTILERVLFLVMVVLGVAVFSMATKIQGMGKRPQIVLTELGLKNGSEQAFYALSDAKFNFEEIGQGIVYFPSWNDVDRATGILRGLASSSAISSTGSAVPMGSGASGSDSPVIRSKRIVENHAELILNFQDNGHFSGLMIKDENFSFIANFDQSSVLSYAINSGPFSSLSNLDTEGKLVQGAITTPMGRFYVEQDRSKASLYLKRMKEEIIDNPANVDVDLNPNSKE